MIEIPLCFKGFLKKRLKQADLYWLSSTAHSIGHSVAVHLLFKVVDLRYVQEMLGHESIESAVAYTHDLDEKIRRIYKSPHPREDISYVELDEDFIKRMMGLKERLYEAKAMREKKREAQKRYYEKNKERILSEKKRRTKGGKSV